MVIEDAIKEEIRSWSKEALEKVNPSFANLPPCPFAEGAWAEDRVGIAFKTCPAFQDLTTLISTWDDKNDLVVLVDLNYIKDSEKFYQHIDGLNEAISQGIFIEKDIWLMAYHPDDEPSDIVYTEDDFLSVVDTDYAMIFIQRLSKLHEAGEKLKKTGYYTEYEQQFGLMDMLRVRETYYRRLKNGS
jgi:hypothetical protein